jgi:hypothetical protein
MLCALQKENRSLERTNERLQRRLLQLKSTSTRKMPRDVEEAKKAAVNECRASGDLEDDADKFTWRHMRPIITIYIPDAHDIDLSRYDDYDPKSPLDTFKLDPIMVTKGEPTLDELVKHIEKECSVWYYSKPWKDGFKEMLKWDDLKYRLRITKMEMHSEEDKYASGHGTILPRNEYTSTRFEYYRKRVHTTRSKTSNFFRYSADPSMKLNCTFEEIKVS